MAIDLRQKIETYLGQNTGWHKAATIASAIGVDKSLINSCLYSNQGKVFVRDGAFAWALRGVQQPAQTEASPVGHARLARLSAYYLACLAKDKAHDVSAWARSKFELEYVELPFLPPLNTSPNDAWDTPGASKLISKLRMDRTRLVLYVGYPTRLRQFRSRAGNDIWRVEPLLLYEYKPSDFGGWPELADDLPVFNQPAIEHLTNAKGPEIIEETVSLAGELGIDSVAADPEDIAAALANIRSVRPDWPWRETMDPLHTSGDRPLCEASEDGIYNRAVLMLAERSPFTVGLEAELAELKTRPAQEVSGTALGYWIDRPAFAAKIPVVAPEPVVEVFPLNSEQREAVSRAMIKPLTVITGPPGTGKSQVVAAIVANCVWHRQSVLVASKNNKAVDVVQARINSAHPRPVLLRVGTSSTTTDLAQHLAAILGGTATSADQHHFDAVTNEHNRLRAQRLQIEEEERVSVGLRNQVDELEKGVESIRQSRGEEKFRLLAQSLPQTLLQEVDAATSASRTASRSLQGFWGRLLWPVLKKRRLANAESRLQPLNVWATAIGETVIPSVIETDSAELVLPFLDQLRGAVIDASKVSEYAIALQRLNRSRGLDSIATERHELATDLAEIGIRLWQAWLTLQPARLTAAQKKTLGEYRALVEMLAQGEQVAGLKKKALQIFPKLTEILLAWGVTNLAARNRVPLAPGFFDLLIIDEASQCDIASALPLLFRAKRVVIIGDPMQLQHITQISGDVEQQLLNQFGVMDDPGVSWAYSGSSLFNLASSLADQGDLIALRDHHRSHGAIIGFSNRHFYGGRLRVATKYDKLHPRPAGVGPIRWVQVSGKVVRPGSGAHNEAEARKVVEELERLLVNGGYRGSVGVVSPFRAQANRIRDLIHSHDRLSEHVVRNQVLVDTVHKFQGDERDLMVFSPVVSQDTPPGAMMFLRKTGNTFNVAITRARSTLVIVGDHAACASCGVEHLQNFAAYAATTNDQETLEPNSPPDAAGEFPPVIDQSVVSDWERTLYRLLYAQGIRPIPQYSVEQYRLDFAVIQGDRRLNIEVDGEHYHRSWTGELCYRDQLRNQRMLELGWDVMRFWVYQIRDTPEWCVARVKSWTERPVTPSR